MNLMVNINTTDQCWRIKVLAKEKPEKSARLISQLTAREIADEVLESKIVAQISRRQIAQLLLRC